MNEGLGELRVSQTLFYVTGNFVLLLQNPQNYESCLIKKKEEYHGRTL